MNKLLSFVIGFLTLCSMNSHAQKYIDRAGHASFFSKASLENIEAHTRQALSMIDLKSGEVVASVLMKSFQFEKALMQEHFNENYVESDKYPKASFKGKVANVEKLDLNKDGTVTLDVSGDLTIHGETKPLQAKVEFAISKGALSAKTKFPVRVKDHKIEIPKLVVNNIAEVVDVTLEFHYQPMTQ